VVALATVTLAVGLPVSAGDQGSKEKVVLRVDPAYSEAGFSHRVSDAALKEQDPAATSVGPRARPGFASFLVHMDPPLAKAAPRRAEVRAFASQVGGRVKYDHPDALALHDSTPLIRGLQSQLSTAGYTFDGSGVRICIVDTGIDSDHVMYSDRIDTAAGRDFYNDDLNPEDDNGHGSHCAGIAAGGTGLTVDFGCGAGAQVFQGVAPGATLIGVKVLNSGGGGFDSDIIAGIDYCADQTASGGRADVISMSIGTGAYTSSCSHSWAVAANNAVANGVVAVAASGNDNFTNALSSPACGASVIAVGATYKADYPTCENNLSTIGWGNCADSGINEDDIVCFSNESSQLDVVAPGAIIWSASNSAGGSSITGKGGTSMSCPHVAGLAALILDADSSLTPSEVRTIIRDGAIDLGSSGFDNRFGYGRIDVINSLALVGAGGCSVNADCYDGEFCNGAETCDAGNCVAGSDPCPGQTCDEAIDVCVPLVCDDDGTCETGEDCNNCSGDCISGSGGGGADCGNGICEAGDGEDCVSCPADCNGVQTGKPSGRFCCGDGDGSNPAPCSDSLCSTGGYECTNVPAGGASYCCGDDICEGAEDGFNCEIDCGAPAVCGDDNCDPGEDSCNCASDCGAAPSTETNCTNGLDDDCDTFTDCDDGADCGAHPACDTTCADTGDSCSVNGDCCSNKCFKRTNACR
jgi:subtilisin family serine protease